MKIRQMTSFSATALLLLALQIGCQGDDSRPTLDYAPENVESIRDVQNLKMPVNTDSSEQESDATDTETQAADAE